MNRRPKKPKRLPESDWIKETNRHLGKTNSRSRVKKGPVRSKSHLARVREQPCLICGRDGVEAHHARVGDRTMGVRKDDTRAVPLCPSHHAELHKGLEEAFWDRHSIDPLAWCRRFTAGGKT